VFELRLKRFHHRAEDKDCAAADLPANGDGSSAAGRRCETKFRVCLKHFMAQVDGSNMCTFGVEVIPMEGRQNDSIQLPPVRFNIGFKWPVRILSALFLSATEAKFLPLLFRSMPSRIAISSDKFIFLLSPVKKFPPSPIINMFERCKTTKNTELESSKKVSNLTFAKH
jgi:hypothetical protein